MNSGSIQSRQALLSHSSILYRAYLHRWWLLFVLALVLLASRAEGASAHASLIRSDPEAGAVLRQPPQSVQLFFSEAIDPSFFEASLVDAAWRKEAAVLGVEHARQFTWERCVDRTIGVYRKVINSV